MGLKVSRLRLTFKLLFVFKTVLSAFKIFPVSFFVTENLLFSLYLLTSVVKPMSYLMSDNGP